MGKMANRVKETTTTLGTGTLDLDGAVAGFQSFAAGFTTGNDVMYVIVDATANTWEVGIGVFTDAAPDTLSRVTVLSSSNAGALVNFAAGTKDVFCDAPQEAFFTSCGVFKSAQTIVNASFTNLTFGTGTDVWNTPPAMHSESTQNDRFVIKLDGIYLVSADAQWASNATGVRRLNCNLNFSNIIRDLQDAGDAQWAAPYHHLNFVRDFVKTDFLEFLTRQESGGNLDLNNIRVSVTRLGDRL